MSKKYYVYQLKSSACQHKSYIGISSNPRKRFRSHLNQEKRKWRELTKCGKAVKRYGADTFTMKILETHTDPDKAMEAETKWIRRLGRKKLWNSTYNSGGSYSGKAKRKKVYIRKARNETRRKDRKKIRKED